MKKLLDSVPKLVLGPILVIIAIIYFTLQDPPKTICDTQFETFRSEKDVEKYYFGYEKNKIKIPAGIQQDIDSCQKSNSPGACYDWMEGIKKLITYTKNIPAQCGERFDEIEPIGKWFAQSVFIYSQISWNNTTSVRDGLFNWLDDDDQAIFCRLKVEYIRLFGAEAWKTQENKNVQELMRLKKMDQKRVRERTILSHRCRSGN